MHGTLILCVSPRLLRRLFLTLLATCSLGCPFPDCYPVLLTITVCLFDTVDFGQCYPRGSTGAVTTCDVTDGTSTIETYLDTTCKTHLYSSKDSPACENLKVDGETCPPGGPASSTTDCTSMGESRSGLASTCIYLGSFERKSGGCPAFNCQSQARVTVPLSMSFVTGPSGVNAHAKHAPRNCPLAGHVLVMRPCQCQRLKSHVTRSCS